MSKNIDYQTNYYNDNNSNEKFLYNEQVNNQNYPQTKDKEYPTFTPVPINQQQSQTQSQTQLQPPQLQQPPPQQSLPNINNMLNYEPDIIEENDKLKKPKLRKTYFKLPTTVSYRMKNKSFIPSNTNMNNDCNGNMNVLSNQLNEDYNLIIRQQPAYARCSNFNDKERRPIDPPPIIQLIFGNEYMDDSNTNSKTLLHTPFFFMSANLVNASDNSQSDEEKDNPKSLEIIENNGKLIKATNGLTVASLTRMKDFDSTYGAFFIFHDMSVCVEGTYRLKFSLYEISGSGKRLFFRKSILSDNFKVLSAREFPGMRESSPLVKLFAEQGLKIRIRKDKSLGKHPSKRIFVDLPGYDYFEKKKTTYIYVGKYPRYGFKETERNNSKNEIVFENETKKVINQNHDDYMKDPNFQNTHDNMYNKYISKQDGYYGEGDYNRDMRGSMGDNYRDMSGNNMIENRNKMNMKNYLNNEEMGLRCYDNNYRMMPPGRNSMNDQDMNKKGNMAYYEESQYSYYSEGKMKMKNQYMNNPPYPNDRRDEYKPNNYNKPNDYNMMPPRPYPNPPMDHPYMNDFNNKKIYDERRNSYSYNDDRKNNNEPMNNPPPPPPNMDRNELYQRMPGGRNGKNEEYDRYRPVKMEENIRRMPNPMYDKSDGNPPYNYPEGPMSGDYSRKRKFNSLEDNYMMNNNDNQYYNPNDPRKGPMDDYDRMIAREKGNADYGHKTFYSAKEEETKTYIRRVQYYDDKRGNDYTKESEGYEGGNYYSNYKSRSEMYKSEGMEPGRPENYNQMIQNKKPPYINNDYPYRNEDNPYNDGRNGPLPPPPNKGMMRYNGQREDNPVMNYRRDYNGIPPNRQEQYDYNSNDYPNNPNNPSGGGNYNYYSNYEEKRFSSSQEMGRFEPNRNSNINPPNIPNKDPYYPGNNDKYYDRDNKSYYNNGNPEMYPSSYLPVKKDNNEPIPRYENRNNESSFKPVMGPDNYNYQQKPNNNGKGNPNMYNQGPNPNYNQNKDDYPPYPNMNENEKRNLYVERKEELNHNDKNNINYRPIPNNSNNKIKDIMNDNNNSSNNEFSNSQTNGRINIRNVINE